MTKKKTILFIVGCTVAIAILAAIILFTFFNVIKQSESYNAAIDYIENNESIIERIGGIKEYGMILSCRINYVNDSATGHYVIKVIGNKETIYVKVNLVKPEGGSWKGVSDDDDFKVYIL